MTDYVQKVHLRLTPAVKSVEAKSALDAQFQNSSIEWARNITMKQATTTLHVRICLWLDSLAI